MNNFQCPPIVSILSPFFLFLSFSFIRVLISFNEDEHIDNPSEILITWMGNYQKKSKTNSKPQNKMQRNVFQEDNVYIYIQRKSLNLFEAAYIRELNVPITRDDRLRVRYETYYVFLVDGAPLSAAHLAYQDKLARLRQVEPAVFCNFPVGCTTGGPRCGKLQPRLFMTDAFRCITPLQTPRTVDAKEEATVILISPYNRVINWILNGTDFLRRRNLEIEARI